jgi:MFS transporter, OPA family, glycerol-3-phosphate transporter
VPGGEASGTDLKGSAMRTEKSLARADAVVWVLWLTYGTFYFCRVNVSAAVPGMQEELGFSKTQIGLILGALKLAYGIGQFVNGQLAERVSPRRLLAVGMLGSAVLSMVFGFGAGLYFLLFVWACNGYAQSLGWPPTMRVAANWFPPQQRGRAIGTIGTGYQLMGALAIVLAGWAAQHFGWRAAMFLPPVILAAAGVFMLFCLREAPADGAGRATASSGSPAQPPPASRSGLLANVRDTLSNPALWLLALALCLLDACRYGFIDWGLTHLKEVQKTGVDTAALKMAVLPLGGIAGAYLAGWASDRYFASRRAPVICILLVLLGLLTLIYDAVVRTSFAGTVVLLALIGFVIFGPQVLLVGTAPVDLARRGTAAAAAGFVNFMGYMGAFMGDQVTGHMVDRFGWQKAVFMWAGWAFGAARLVAILWNAKPAAPHDPY